MTCGHALQSFWDHFETLKPHWVMTTKYIASDISQMWRLLLNKPHVFPSISRIQLITSSDLGIGERHILHDLTSLMHLWQSTATWKIILQWLVAQYGSLCVLDELWFQQDRTTPYPTLLVPAYLAEIFLSAERWTAGIWSNVHPISLPPAKAKHVRFLHWAVDYLYNEHEQTKILKDTCTDGSNPYSLAHHTHITIYESAFLWHTILCTESDAAFDNTFIIQPAYSRLTY